MTFKPAIWYPVAVLLSVVNVAGAWFAAGPGEPWHATIHAALAVMFGLWAQRLRQDRGMSENDARFEALEAEARRIEALEAEVVTLGQDVSELQERLDFAERLLTRGP